MKVMRLERGAVFTTTDIEKAKSVLEVLHLHVPKIFVDEKPFLIEDIEEVAVTIIVRSKVRELEKTSLSRI